MTEPRVVREDELGEGQHTAGMTRREAFSGEGVWAGTATTEPGAISGWHHHGTYDTYLYCISGVLKVESGPGGERVAEARAGDFMRIPPATIHREGNPSGEEQQIVVVRFGSGPVVVNVDEPEP